MLQDLVELLLDGGPRESGLHGGSGVGGRPGTWVQGTNLSLEEELGGDGL
mgnify:CR=1 FL=1